MELFLPKLLKWSESCSVLPCSLWPPWTVHGILQAKILEWVAYCFSSRSSLPSNRTRVSCIAGRFFTSRTTRETIKIHCFMVMVKGKAVMSLLSVWDEIIHMFRVYIVRFTLISGLLCLTWIKKITYWIIFRKECFKHERKVKVKVAQTYLTLCDPRDCSPQGSSVHGDSPGKDSTVGFHGLLQEIFPNQGLNPDLPHCRQILYQVSHQGNPVLNMALSLKKKKKVYYDDRFQQLNLQIYTHTR